MSTSIKRPPVYRISLIQMALSAIMALLFLFRGPDAAVSALIGGLISAIPNAYFIYKTFLFSGARQTTQVLKSFYQGGTWKMVLTATGFAAAFKLIHPIDLMALFGAFIVVQSTNFFASKIANL